MSTQLSGDDGARYGRLLEGRHKTDRMDMTVSQLKQRL